MCCCCLFNLPPKTGYQVFALQAGGWCASSPTALDTYKKYGPSSNCGNDGEGGKWANQVYQIKFDGKEHLMPSLPNHSTFST